MNNMVKVIIMVVISFLLFSCSANKQSDVDEKSLDSSQEAFSNFFQKKK